MLIVSLRNLLARKLRLVLSASAIVIGIAFVAGTLILTDTMSGSFDDIVKGGTSDAVVRPDARGDWSAAAATVDTRTIPARVVRELGAAPGVARVDANVESQRLFVVRSDGKLLGGTGAPTLSFSYNEAPAMTGEPSVTISAGSRPRGPHEVVLDGRSAELAGYQLGDTVRMVTTGERPAVRAKLVGLADFGGGGLAGATLVFFDVPTAQRLFLDGRDVYTSVALTAEDGVSQQQLARAADRLLPAGLEAVTGDQLVTETMDEVGTAITYINVFLLVFAGIALVVGTFLIVNTFSILVAQRSRELAVLRALGASRRQVNGSVLLEAAVVGLVGATLGLLGGWLLGLGLKVAFGQFGLDLSETQLVFSVRTVIVSYVVGLVVTLFAAYLPARRASHVPPIAAMQDQVSLPESTIRRRMLGGLGLGLLGAGALVVGLALSGDAAMPLVGAGVLGILLAVSLMSPVLGRPILRAVGSAYRRLFGTMGTLATENSLRNPRRTAATASALMIGLALVSTMSVIGASMNASIERSVDEQFTTDFILTNPVGAPFSTTVAARAGDVQGVGEVTQMQWLPTEIRGRSDSVVAADPARLVSVFDLATRSGTLRLGDGQVALSESAAADYDAAVGDRLALRFPTGLQRVDVVGTYADSAVVGAAIAPFSLVTAAAVPRFDSVVAIDAAQGASTATVGRALERLVDDVPSVTVQSKTEFSEAQRASVDQLLYLVYGLLGLGIVIAVLGIVNTLALSVIERTREVGLLRAVGVSRRQLRLMIRLEAIEIAVLGAVLGVLLGVGFGVVLQQAVADQGITELAIPAGRLLVFVILAALVGVLAAVFPARRAARLDVLRAITTE